MKDEVIEGGSAKKSQDGIGTPLISCIQPGYIQPPPPPPYHHTNHAVCLWEISHNLGIFRRCSYSSLSGSEVQKITSNSRSLHITPSSSIVPSEARHLPIGMINICSKGKVTFRACQYWGVFCHDIHSSSTVVRNVLFLFAHRIENSEVPAHAPNGSTSVPRQSESP